MAREKIALPRPWQRKQAAYVCAREAGTSRKNVMGVNDSLYPISASHIIGGYKLKGAIEADIDVHLEVQDAVLKFFTLSLLE
ncbi:hypothetical protein HGM15179_015038 [Zosterops borbonicus]|uniref:Uncharacterized protein n=1 Tax=Zosterops borbonicus TaxID=364589 RepID=A0A8K1G5F1_9PASS|nr:hypothetical protein HGM15179_015038 [Zosterops borbonicus]